MNSFVRSAAEKTATTATTVFSPRELGWLGSRDPICLPSIHADRKGTTLKDGFILITANGDSSKHNALFVSKA